MPSQMFSCLNLINFPDFTWLCDCDHDKFIVDLERVSWHKTALNDDVSEMLDYVNINILNVLESHAGIRTVKIRPHCYPFVDTNKSAYA